MTGLAAFQFTLAAILWGFARPWIKPLAIVHLAIGALLMVTLP